MIQMLTDPSNLLSAFVAIVVFATIVTLAAPAMSGNG
ncbi:MAG: type II secretion system F family protein, partial [Caulobacter sp.]|nr:type II secretion system F family protein [Caulobacter sp.]